MPTCRCIGIDYSVGIVGLVTDLEQKILTQGCVGLTCTPLGAQAWHKLVDFCVVKVKADVLQGLLQLKMPDLDNPQTFYRCKSFLGGVLSCL